MIVKVCSPVDQSSFRIFSDSGLVRHRATGWMVHVSPKHDQGIEIEICPPNRIYGLPISEIDLQSRSSIRTALLEKFWYHATDSDLDLLLGDGQRDGILAPMIHLSSIHNAVYTQAVTQ